MTLPSPSSDPMRWGGAGRVGYMGLGGCGEALGDGVLEECFVYTHAHTHDGTRSRLGKIRNSQSPFHIQPFSVMPTAKSITIRHAVDVMGPFTHFLFFILIIVIQRLIGWCLMFIWHSKSSALWHSKSNPISSKIFKVAGAGSKRQTRVGSKVEKDQGQAILGLSLKSYFRWGGDA